MTLLAPDPPRPETNRSEIEQVPAYSPAAASWAQRHRRRLRNVIARYPAVYMALVRRNGRRGLLRADTQLVIEGFPRCANSFAEAAFRVAQPAPVRLAHHSHAPAHVIAAVRQGVPTLVLVRDPDQAVASLIVRDPQNYRPKECFREYIDFYTSVLPYAEHFVAADFTAVTADFGVVIKAINKKFATDFEAFVPTDENVRRARSLVDDLALERIGRLTPYSHRHNERFKCHLRKLQASVDAEITKPCYTAIRAEAAALYRDFTSTTAMPT